MQIVPLHGLSGEGLLITCDSPPELVRTGDERCQALRRLTGGLAEFKEGVFHMRFTIRLLCLALLLLPTGVLAAQQTPAQPPSLVDRLGTTGFIQLYADSFKSLSLDQKLDAYWLSRAAIAVDPIAYDQNAIYGLREKRLLEQILTHSAGIDPTVLKKITDYTKLFLGNRGNHNAFTSSKFLPEFTPRELSGAAHRALKNGAHLGPAAKLARELRELRRPVFDVNFQPMTTEKNPPDGGDPLLESGNNLYQGVSLADLKGFQEKFPLNSRLVKKNGKLVEEVYRAGTPDGKIPPGLYAKELGQAIQFLKKALPYSTDSQKKVINDLIRYYQTGARADWIQCGIDWVHDPTNPDFSNGFVEVYRDARGAKGAIQGFVTVVDQPMNRLMKGFAENAAYFEQRAPWDAKYKNENPRPPLVNADEAVIETGDFFVSTIGDNLPNEAEIHEKYGSKS
ncbi:MAG: dipeptidyl-peptidase 3 family protein, partial [Terriglobia bacterium]